MLTIADTGYIGGGYGVRGVQDDPRNDEVNYPRAGSLASVCKPDDLDPARPRSLKGTSNPGSKSPGTSFSLVGAQMAFQSPGSSALSLLDSSKTFRNPSVIVHHMVVDVNDDVRQLSSRLFFDQKQNGAFLSA